MKKPNILVFMTDHQRADTVLSEGPVIMENVNKLGQEGIILEQAYCSMPHCCPSRASFFSGLYPSMTGIWNNVCNEMALGKGLKPGVKLFSEYLKTEGYNLAFSGKWHVSVEESPKDRGFEELMVSAKKGTHNGTTWEQLEKQAREDMPSQREYGTMSRPGYGVDRLFGTLEDDENLKYQHDKKAVDLAVEKIKEYGDKDAPWMIYVGAKMPHAPYTISQRYLDLYPIEDIKIPSNFYDTFEDKPNYYKKLRNMTFSQLSEVEVKDAIRHFYAMCTALDDMFGCLLKTLDATGQKDNTLVLYISDHGDYLGEHGLFHKGVPSFSGASHIPAVIRWPDEIRNPGRRIKEIVSITDFAPTFLDVANINNDSEMSGNSILPFIKNEKPEEWRSLLFTQCNGVENYFTQRSVFNSKYKYVFNGFDFDEFYDLTIDPGEMVNRATDPSYKEIRHDLISNMWKFARKTKDPLAIDANYIMVSTAEFGPMSAIDK